MASVVAKKEREVIIVAYDGSDRSRKCLRYALTLMDKSKDTLEVVLPMHKEAAVKNDGEWTWVVPLKTQAIAKSIEDSLAKQFADEHVVNTHIRMLPTANVGELLTAHAVAVGATLVITSSKDMGVLQKILEGSTSDTLLHDANCPVLVVHNDDPFPAGPAKWMVAVDGRVESQFAFSKALELAKKEDTFYLVQVKGPGKDSKHPNPNTMDNLRKLLDDHKIASVSLNLDGADTAAEVINCVKDKHPSYLVLGSGEVSGVKKFFFGCVSEACVKAAPCPVLVVKRPAHLELPQ